MLMSSGRSKRCGEHRHFGALAEVYNQSSTRCPQGTHLSSLQKGTEGDPRRMLA